MSDRKAPARGIAAGIAISFNCRGLGVCEGRKLQHLLELLQKHWIMSLRLTNVRATVRQDASRIPSQNPKDRSDQTPTQQPKRNGPRRLVLRPFGFPGQ